ncbi:hypothetical protein GWI33_010988, partial [Rhynchophorus ferrugineus]
LDDAEIIVDAYQGRVFIHPPRRLRTKYKEIKKEEDLIAKDLKQYETKSAITPDGVAIPLYVNTGLMIDVVRGVQRGAKGVGLYRSEIPFMLRERFPGEEEQRAIYRQQLSHFANKPVVMRTLDIGADKDLPYFSIEEENSALGWRGIRFTLDHPEIFSTQVRAMLKASIGLNNLHILLPMITSVSEVEEVLYLLDRDLAAVQEEEQVKITRPKVGIMIEYETKSAITPDGVAIPLYVNTGLMIDVVRGVQRGAKGVGLYRSEIPFMLRERFPGEEEQRAIYRQQLSHFANKPVVMRTLDIGADKDLPYFSIEEENSALGWRGIRFTLDHPEIFSTQVRAMLKASIGLNNLHILLPMITSVSEVEEVLYLLDRDLAAVQEEEQVKITRPKVGIMIEVPS